MADWNGLAGHILASRGLRWAGGSHFESGMSSSLPIEPKWAPCGWVALPAPAPHFDRRPIGNGT
jgi:hypothetical protein